MRQGFLWCGRLASLESLVILIAEVIDVLAGQAAIEPPRMGIVLEVGGEKCRLVNGASGLDENPSGAEPRSLIIQRLLGALDHQLGRDPRIPGDVQPLAQSLVAINARSLDRIASGLVEIMENDLAIG